MKGRGYRRGRSGLSMPSALDLLGHHQGLQEHWLRRFFAFLVDLVIIGILFVPLGLFLSFWAWNAVFGPLIWGAVWFLYTFLLGAAIGGTIGKKILSLRVVAIGANLDAGRSLIRNISRVHGLFFFLDWLARGCAPAGAGPGAAGPPPGLPPPAPPAGPQAPPPGGWQQQGWPGAPPPQSQWPQHK